MHSLQINEDITKIGTDVASSLESTQFYITGPAGIAGDTTKLFAEADFNLLIDTIVIILILLIVDLSFPVTGVYPTTGYDYCVSESSIKRSPYLAQAGLEINNSTTSIMKYFTIRSRYRLLPIKFRAYFFSSTNTSPHTSNKNFLLSKGGTCI